MKKIAISTWCTDDYVDYLGVEQLTNSIKYFHPEVDWDSVYPSDWDAEGGIMYGIEGSFDKINVSYTIYKGEMGNSSLGYYDVDANRMVLSYSF